MSPAPAARASLFSAPATPNKWLTMFAVCLGLGMLMIDTFVVNVAFPAIGKDLDASLSTAEWTVSGYVLVLGVLPLAMGRLGDLFGRRRLYLVGLVVFVFASAASGFAANIEQLIAFRLVQGVGAAVMMPGTLSIITAAFPAEQRGLAIGLWGGVSGLGLIAGPLLGGVLVETGDWRWIFLVNLPLGLAAFVLALRWVGESRDEHAPRSVDWAGVTLLAGGLFALMFALTRANEEGWTSGPILALFAGGGLLLGLFLLVEARVRAPLVELSLFRAGPFVVSCISAFLFSAAVFGSQPFSSLFMQNYMGLSPIEGGLAFLPATALVALLMPVSGILGQKLGPRLRLVVMAGSLSVALSFAYLLTIDVGVTYASGLLPAFLLRGLGIGLVMSATSLAAMSSVPVARAGLASGTLTMFRQVGTALGVALFGAVYLQHVDGALPGRLEAAPAAQAAQVSAAAERFVPSGEGDVRAAASEEIVGGFVLLSASGVAVAALAAGAAAFIRYRGPAASPAPAPAPASAIQRAPGDPAPEALRPPSPSL